MKKLRDIFFVQNKISKIEGLEGLTELRNLELGGNRIRVRHKRLVGPRWSVERLTMRI